MIYIIAFIAFIYCCVCFGVSVHKETKGVEGAVWMIGVGIGLAVIAICFK